MSFCKLQPGMHFGQELSSNAFLPSLYDRWTPPPIVCFPLPHWQPLRELALVQLVHLGAAYHSGRLPALPRSLPHIVLYGHTRCLPLNALDGFCLSYCGLHSSAPSAPTSTVARSGNAHVAHLCYRFTYVWVGNAVEQFLGFVRGRSTTSRRRHTFLVRWSFKKNNKMDMHYHVGENHRFARHAF
jgi:hypothetical protein